MLSAQNQQFGSFPSLVMFPSVVWLLCAFFFLLKMNIQSGSTHFLWFPLLFWRQCVSHSKSIFWVVPFTLHGSLCCLVPMGFPLKINIIQFGWFKGLYADHILIPRAQPEVVYFLISNESPYFLIANPKFQLEVLCSFWRYNKKCEIKWYTRK